MSWPFMRMPASPPVSATLTSAAHAASSSCSVLRHRVARSRPRPSRSAHPRRSPKSAAACAVISRTRAATWRALTTPLTCGPSVPALNQPASLAACGAARARRAAAGGPRDAAARRLDEAVESLRRRLERINELPEERLALAREPIADLGARQKLAEPPKLREERVRRVEERRDLAPEVGRDARLRPTASARARARSAARRASTGPSAFSYSATARRQRGSVCRLYRRGCRPAKCLARDGPAAAGDDAGAAAGPSSRGPPRGPGTPASSSTARGAGCNPRPRARAGGGEVGRRGPRTEARELLARRQEREHVAEAGAQAGGEVVAVRRAVPGPDVAVAGPRGREVGGRVAPAIAQRRACRARQLGSTPARASGTRLGIGPWTSSARDSANGASQTLPRARSRCCVLRATAPPTTARTCRMRPAGYLEAVVTRAGARDDSAPASPGRRSQGTGACALPWPRPAALHAASSESRTMSMTSAVSAQDTACAGRGTIAHQRSRASLEERARPPPEPERGSQTRLRASSATNDARSGSSALWTAWTRSPSMPRDDRARSQKSSSSTGACTAAQSSSDAYGGRRRSPVVSDTKKFVDGASHAVWPVMEGGLSTGPQTGRPRTTTRKRRVCQSLARTRARARADADASHPQSRVSHGAPQRSLELREQVPRRLRQSTEISRLQEKRAVQAGERPLEG